MTKTNIKQLKVKKDYLITNKIKYESKALLQNQQLL